jgi:hypothetical protein
MSFFLTFFNVDLFQFFFPSYDPEFWLSLSISLASVGTSALMVYVPYPLNFPFHNAKL